MFRSGTQLVDLFVTVTDRNGRLVPDLLREDFEVFDDGRPAEIVLFENDVRPITVVVMLDTSASMDLNRRRLMAAGATDGFVTDFGPKLSVFFRDPDRMECEVLVANPDAVPDRFNPPGTPAVRYQS